MNAAARPETVPAEDPAEVSLRSRLAVLGPLTIEVDGAVVVSRGERQRRLFNVLAAAASHGRSVPADELTAALYDDRPPQRARHSVATAVWRARQLIGTDAIVTDDAGHRIDPARCDIDVVEFEALVAQGRANLHAQAYVAAQKEFGQALSLWRGAALADWRNQPAGRAAADRLDELRLGCVEDHAEALIRLGRYVEAIDALATLTSTHPEREHAWALLVEGCVRGGQDARARVAFDSARRVLAEYGIEAGAELSAAQQLLDGTAAPPVPGGLVGRERELAHIVDCLRDTMASACAAAAVISGEAGIGKSALADHAADVIGAATGARVERVHCDRRLDTPLAVLLPSLSRLAGHVEPRPALAEMLAGSPDRDDAVGWTHTSDELRDSVVDHLERSAAALGGLLLVVEDAHWACRDLLDVLAHVLARRAHVPLAVIIIARRHAAIPEPVEQALGELRSRAQCVTELRGLDHGATAALLGREVDDRDTASLHELTGGNPLYLRLAAPARRRAASPGSLPDAIEARLSDLPQSSRRILTLAAIQGTRFDLRVITAAASQAPVSAGPVEVADAVEIAERAGLVCTEGPDRHERRFVHALVRDHLHDTTAISERRAAHVLIAEALERVTTSSHSLVALVAHHYASGWPSCPTETVVAQLRRAGEQASAQLAFERAGEYYRQGLDIVAMDPSFTDDPAVVDLLDAAARTSIAAARGLDATAGAAPMARARHSFHTMHEIAERSGLADARLRASLGTVQTYALEPVDAAALDALTSAVRAVIERGNTRSESLPAAIGALLSYRPDAARDLLERAVCADPGSSGRLLAVAWDHEDVAGKSGLARRLVEDATADPAQARLRLWVSEAITGDRALDDSPPLPPGPWEWETHAWRTTVALATGQFTRAEELISLGRARLGASSPTQLARREAVLRAHQFRLALLREGGPFAPDRFEMPAATWTITHPVVRTWTAYFAAMTGQREFAWRVCDQSADELEDGLIPGGDLLTQLCALSVAAVAIKHTRAARLCRAALAPHAGRAGAFSVTTYWGFADHHLGRLAALDGDHDAAVVHLHEALRLHRRVRARCWEAQTLRSLAAALWHRGRAADRTDALSHQREAVTLAQRLGMAGLARAPWPPPTAFD